MPICLVIISSSCWKYNINKSRRDISYIQVHKVFFFLLQVCDGKKKNFTVRFRIKKNWGLKRVKKFFLLSSRRGKTKKKEKRKKKIMMSGDALKIYFPFEKVQVLLLTRAELTQSCFLFYFPCLLHDGKFHFLLKFLSPNISSCQISFYPSHKIPIGDVSEEQSWIIEKLTLKLNFCLFYLLTSRVVHICCLMCQGI